MIRRVCSGEGIVSIVQCPSQEKSSDFYVGDESGAITSMRVTPHGKVENLWRLILFGRQSAPSVLRWKQHRETAPLSQDDNKCTLQVISTNLGIFCDYTVQRNVALYFNAAGGIDPTRYHKSFVETFAALVELDILVTAGSENYACLWSLSTGMMVGRIELKEFYVTSIATYDSGYVAGGEENNIRFCRSALLWTTW